MEERQGGQTGCRHPLRFKLIVVLWVSLVLYGEGRTGWLPSGGLWTRRDGLAITHSGEGRLGALGGDVAGLATTEAGRGARALLLAVAIAVPAEALHARIGGAW